MKTSINRFVMALWAILSVVTFPTGCNSSTEKKADQIRDEQKDVLDAAESGADVDEVREQQAEVDSARKEYTRQWRTERDNAREDVNATIEDIDDKIAYFERSVPEVDASRKKNLQQAILTLKTYRQRMADELKNLEFTSAENWPEVKARMEYLVSKTDAQVNAVRAD
ncbi:hypothetical protein DYU11_00170 [Fibrisoma montanum]|uniref:Uncharacterized protein n=1 Tax=Fibrisoma montanum TaxID=2305895 RepID=A0A418MH86_9BACT|nr:hypothetical protein [Fibrisoma montanum]RIV26775.1 hypothetical protein DYU11_00170 [Fibrisoma montanum]